MVALWDEAGEWFVDAYGVRSEDVVVIPNARCTDTYRPPTAGERRAAREQFGIASDQQVVAVVGSLTSEKRVGLALAAIAKVEGAVALIVGDGPERSSLEAIAHEKLSERAIFTGVLDDVRPAYWAIDALLVTSRTEGMPGVVIEAAMSGVPVASTAVGALSSMIDQGIPGWSLTTTSPTDLSGIVRAALSSSSVPIDPSLFGWPDVVERWIRLVEDVLGSEKIGPPSAYGSGS